MKLKLKKCVTDEDFGEHGIIDHDDDYNLIREGRFEIEDVLDDGDYYIRLENDETWYVPPYWFITVKE